ncbi:MAG TPA: PLP-dependent aminotransferase family protein [Steroidobacteraceae bacterium]|nr:PLP-dependent aminotransferase family protein [Steroidobacteraceae bacterium]
MRLYERLAGDLETLIREGTLRAGARAPSIRGLCRERATSPATVVRAYELLEARGLLESRVRSGFFVRGVAPARPAPAETRRPERVDVSQLVFQILEAARQRDCVPLGSAFPSPELFPLRQLGRHLAFVAQHLDPWSTVEDLPPGSLQLRRQIAQRYRLGGAEVSPDEIVITAGGLEALNLALQVVTAPNDIVAIEAPSFYGCLQAIERSGRQAVEIPTSPEHGLDLDVLERTLREVPVKACWFMTTFHNPLGASLPTSSKERLVQMLAAREIPLIEDNVYAELYFGRDRPRITKVWDKTGLILDCGSFAKTLAPGYRLGWIAAGRFAAAVRNSKITTSLATSIPIQAAISRYLDTGVYDRHLAKLRRTLERQQTQLVAALEAYFPSQCSWLCPAGGYQLWVQLPEGVNALDLHARALEHEISVAPGPLFSARREFTRAIRLNYGHPWSARTDRAIKTLGELITRQCAAVPSKRRPGVEL